jgi:CBS domain-containing protein
VVCRLTDGCGVEYSLLELVKTNGVRNVEELLHMTSTRILRISASEVVRSLRDEIASTNSQPELNLTISKEYVRKKAPRGRTRSADQGPQLDLVNGFALLTIEPRRERDYWVLRVEVETPVGLRSPYDEHGLASRSLTMDEFDEELRSLKDKRIRLRLDAETPAARNHFDRWLSEMRKRHPPPSKKQASQQAVGARSPLTSSTGSVVNHESSRQGHESSDQRQAIADQESAGKVAMHVDKLLPLARKKLVLLKSDAPLIQAARLLARKEANLVVICNSAGTLVGVVAKTDIVRRFCSRRGSSGKSLVSVAMTRKVISCRPRDFLVDVWSTMKTHGLKHLPIIDPDSRPIGLAIARDILGLLIEEAEQEGQLLRDYVMGVGYH